MTISRDDSGCERKAWLTVNKRTIWRPFNATSCLVFFFFSMYFQYSRDLAEKSFLYQIIGNATFSVDSFFFISGLLVTLLFFRKHKSDQSSEAKDSNQLLIKSNFWKSILLIVYRYLRLTPAYLFVIIANEVSLRWVEW